MTSPVDPARLRFRERLDATLVHAQRAGALAEAEHEELLVDPDFDAAEFERFRAAAAGFGVALPALEPDPEAGGEVRARGAEPERDLLDLYLDEIGRIPLLAHEELLAVARRSRAGDARARRQIILANLRLVVHLARAYRNRGLPMLDVIEEGNLGLIQAVDRFEPERGLRFSTYAAIWIRQSILRGIAEQARSVRIPVQMFQQIHRYVRAERTLRARLGRDPVIAEVADEMKISPARADRLAALLRGVHSLDEEADLAAFEQVSADALVATPLSVEELVDLQLQHEKIDRLLRSLSEREEQILRIRYGFLDGVARTLAETGQAFGITRERVRQIESRALAKLRHALELPLPIAPVGPPPPIPFPRRHS
jgi:RNA polymerase primary sigma factor